MVEFDFWVMVRFLRRHRLTHTKARRTRISINLRNSVVFALVVSTKVQEIDRSNSKNVQKRSKSENREMYDAIIEKHDFLCFTNILFLLGYAIPTHPP